jgi:hypothetical protein
MEHYKSRCNERPYTKKSRKLFRQALIDSGSQYLAEATSIPFWASGLGPDITLVTKPSHMPRQNNLGKILMEKRADLQNPPKAKSNLNNKFTEISNQRFRNVPVRRS